jgi:hypothetical protein
MAIIYVVAKKRVIEKTLSLYARLAGFREGGTVKLCLAVAEPCANAFDIRMY